MSLADRFAPLLARWQSLAARERLLLGAGATVIFATLVFLGVVEPAQKAAERRQTELQQARALAVRLEQIAAEIRSAPSSPAADGARGLSLIAAVDQAVKSGALGKPPSRLQPDGDKLLKVWFEDVAFDSLAPWLFDLETRYGVHLRTVDIERESASGLVSVQLELARP